MRRLILSIAGISALLMLFAQPGLAVRPDEIMDDPAMEKRAREISKDIRCVVCQNQSIDDSDAGLARDLRVLIRERLSEGDSNAEVRDYLVARYGEFVLLNPPMRMGTLVLWIAPAVLVLLGALAVFFWFRGLGKRGPTPGAALSADEEARLSALLDRGGSTNDRQSGKGRA